MGLHGSLVMLIFVLPLWFEKVVNMRTESSSLMEAQALDAILQDYAYRALINPKTGTIYDGNVPSNLTGIKVAALRLRSGSLRRRGFHMYKEFNISTGLTEKPYVERLVLVYQNLGNWTTKYYQLPNYTYLAPVLGLLAYDGSNLSATKLQELDINASGDPILVKFQNIKLAPDGMVAKCVWFDLHGSSNFSNVIADNMCSTSQQGHFSIVVESIASPTPSAQAESRSKMNVWIIVGFALGGMALLMLLSLLVLLVKMHKRKKRMQSMERAAATGEALHMASVGDTRAPLAIVTRTQPTLEHDYVP